MSAIPKSAIIVPLYLYPKDSFTWQPLYKVIEDYRDLQFIVIVNPNSGPGVDASGWLPDKHYYREIPRLNSYANVTTVGYVRLGYCRRPYDEISEDLTKYANWAHGSSTPSMEQRDPESSHIKPGSDIAMKGVFFDEAPNIWKTKDAALLDKASTLVKTLDGFQGDRLTIFNCGTVPDPDYALHWSGNLPIPLDTSSLKSFCSTMMGNFKRLAVPDALKSPKAILGAPDIIVMFEESYHLWLDFKWQTRLEHLLRHKRESCCFMVHSVPQSSLQSLTRALRSRGQYLFITGLTEHFYESFGDSWQGFVDAMAAQE